MQSDNIYEEKIFSKWMDNPGQIEPLFRLVRATYPGKLSHPSGYREPVEPISCRMYVCAALSSVNTF